MTSDYTRPSTRYLNLRSDISTASADAGRLSLAHGRFPLAWMLSPTQIGAGLIAGEGSMRLPSALVLISGSAAAAFGSISVFCSVKHTPAPVARCGIFHPRRCVSSEAF